MCVALGHGNILVSEQFLHVEQARPTPDGHACESVPEVVDAEVLDSRTLAGLVEGVAQVGQVSILGPLTLGEGLLNRYALLDPGVLRTLC